IAGWCLATATSIVLSSVALSPVLSTARAESGDLPDISRLPAPAAVAETSAAPLPSSSSSKSARPSPSRSRPSPKPPTKDPEPTEVTPTTRPPATTEDGWTVTTSDGVKTYVRSFVTGGGTAVIRMSSKGTVALVTATPADGFQVVKQGSDVNLAVYFNAPNHSFIIHAQWHNDAPFVEISEVGG
ncbi:MAG TPA: DNA mismatch repair protein MutL, partial [Actinoplanes sp.]|nr:DNA mismatch repair protein MutL [Actinoplanes sp.]